MNLPSRADAVVVGGGVMGASIAYHLTVRGLRDVLLLERAHVCAGPTGRSTAITRRVLSVTTKPVFGPG